MGRGFIGLSVLSVIIQQISLPSQEQKQFFTLGSNQNWKVVWIWYVSNHTNN